MQVQVQVQVQVHEHMCMHQWQLVLGASGSARVTTAHMWQGVL